MNLKETARIVLCAATLSAMAGCVGSAEMAVPTARTSARKSASPRKLIKRAWLTVKVNNVAAAAVRATTIVKEAEG